MTSVSPLTGAAAPTIASALLRSSASVMHAGTADPSPQTIATR